MSQEEHLKSILSGRSTSKPPGASRNAFNTLNHQKPQFKTDGTEIDWFYKLDSKNITQFNGILFINLVKFLLKSLTF